MMAIYMYLLRASQGSYPEKYHKGLLINGSYNCTTEQQSQGAAAELTMKKGLFCPFPTAFTTPSVPWANVSLRRPIINVELSTKQRCGPLLCIGTEFYIFTLCLCHWQPYSWVLPSGINLTGCLLQNSLCKGRWSPGKIHCDLLHNSGLRFPQIISVLRCLCATEHV